MSDYAQRKGTVVKTRKGQWQPVVSVEGVDGKETKRRLKLIPGESEAKARDRAAHWQARFDAEGVVRPEPTRKPAAVAATRANEDEGERWWQAFFEERSQRLTGRDKAPGQYRAHPSCAQVSSARLDSR